MRRGKTARPAFGAQFRTASSARCCRPLFLHPRARLPPILRTASGSRCPRHARRGTVSNGQPTGCLRPRNHCSPFRSEMVARSLLQPRRVRSRPEPARRGAVCARWAIFAVREPRSRRKPATASPPVRCIPIPSTKDVPPECSPTPGACAEGRSLGPVSPASYQRPNRSENPRRMAVGRLFPPWGCS